MTAQASHAFGSLLRRYRLMANLSQQALAEGAGLSPNTIAALERGRRATPRPDTVALLADALQLGLEDRTTLITAATATGHLDDSTRPARPANLPDTSAAVRLLPTPPTPFIGREREVAAVVRLLRAEVVGVVGGRLVTLTGPGGVGKTRLALAVAESVRDDYADGAAFVDLSSLVDPALVAATIAKTLGLRESGSQDARTLVLAHLRDRELLLVLDNLEQIVEAAPLVGELVAACPRLAVVTTSRVALRLRAEQRFDVLPLDVPDRLRPCEDAVEDSPAVRLFVARAQAVLPGFALDAQNVEAVVEICRRLDGVPLAIELAAARIRLLAPRQMLRRLERRLPLLQGGPRDVPARQQTLRATLKWSYALLSEWESALFRRLSVFAGGCTLQAVEAVVTLGEMEDGAGGDVLAGMATLVDHSLLRRIPGDSSSLGGQNGRADQALIEPRLRMLETVREFGLEQLALSGEEDEVRSAHGAYFLALLENAKPHLFGPEQVRWLDLLEREGDNLRATLTDARERGDAEQGVRLVGALWRFWYIRCHLGEGCGWLREFVSLSAYAGLAEAKRVDALVGLAVMAYARTEYDEASIAAEEAAAATRAEGDLSNLAVSLNILGGVARYRSAFARAEALGEECVAVARSMSDRWTLALSLHNLADVVRLRGGYEQARSLAGESLALSRAIEDRWGIAQALLTMGRIASDLGEADEASALFEESLAIVRELGHTRDVALALAGLGSLAHYQGDYERAVTLMEESLTLLRPLGDMIRVAEVSIALGRTRDARGEGAQAAEAYTEGLSINRALGNRLGVAEALEGVAALGGEWEVAAHAERSARLLGAAEALRGAIGAPLAPADRSFRERVITAVHIALGDEAFKEAWAAGWRLSLDGAIAEAGGTRR